MKILSFGASTSSKSINRQFANYVANLREGAVVTDLDLSTFDLPIFSEDEETENGIPSSVGEFLSMIREHDAMVISMAEHNGSYTAAFKNLYDWSSRAEYQVWGEKPMLLLATSPGARGGQTVLEAASQTFPRMGAELVGSYALGNFYDVFKEGELNDEQAVEELRALVNKL